tara:strand:- start:72775 stop:74148 length:1374 start_codon:yes stop_codon:yes gene_type:complete
MKKFLILILTYSFLAQAGVDDLRNAPNSFVVDGLKAVFVDFKKVTYNIVYDFKSESAEVETTILFVAKESGMPIFDSVEKPKAVWIEGQEVDSKIVITPGETTAVRYAQINIQANRPYTMKIRTPLKKGTKYGYKGVSSGFFIKDLKNREMLEQYVPTNLEYDQYPMTWHVEILNANHRWHDIFANGVVENYAQNKFTVKMPDHYTASSVFFHLVPRRKFWRYYLRYRSINGRLFPVTIYSSFRWLNGMLKRKAFKVLAELERDYGPYPHPSLVIYGPSKFRGGMEYVGATATSVVSLGHELHHMWFAKGVMPADGNAGWMDEGLASWRDKGYQTLEKPFYFSANLGHHNPYTRKTDKRSYEYGRSFFGYIDYQLKAAGLAGLKDFLKLWATKKMFKSVTTEDFISELEAYSGMDFRSDFSQYVYGGYAKGNSRSPAVEPINEHHPDYTQEELDEMI